MYIFITGEAGFLGRHWCDKFLAKKPKIANLDNLSTGSKTNSALLLNYSNFKSVPNLPCLPCR